MKATSSGCLRLPAAASACCSCCCCTACAASSDANGVKRSTFLLPDASAAAPPCGLPPPAPAAAAAVAALAQGLRLRSLVEGLWHRLGRLFRDPRLAREAQELVEVSTESLRLRLPCRDRPLLFLCVQHDGNACQQQMRVGCRDETRLCWGPYGIRGLYINSSMMEVVDARHLVCSAGGVSCTAANTHSHLGGFGGLALSAAPCSTGSM